MWYVAPPSIERNGCMGSQLEVKEPVVLLPTRSRVERRTHVVAGHGTSGVAHCTSTSAARMRRPAMGVDDRTS